MDPNPRAPHAWGPVIVSIPRYAPAPSTCLTGGGLWILIHGYFVHPYPHTSTPLSARRFLRLAVANRIDRRPSGDRTTRKRTWYPANKLKASDAFLVVRLFLIVYIQRPKLRHAKLHSKLCLRFFAVTNQRPEQHCRQSDQQAS